MGIGSLQNAYDNSKTQNTEHPYLNYFALRAAALSEATAKIEPASLAAIGQQLKATHLMLTFSVKWASKCLGLDGTLDMPMIASAPVSEIFSMRLTRRVGINSPDVRVTRAEPASERGYIKHRGAWIESVTIPKSLPVYFLAQCERLPLACDIFTGPVTDMFREIDKELRVYMIGALDKPTLVRRASYADFEAGWESDPEILAAGRWDSPQRLLIHALRAFLYMTYGHSSNVLVGRGGVAWSIDHERICQADDPRHSDIAELFEAVKDSNQPLRACRAIAGLSRSDIEAALSAIPDWLWKLDNPVFQSAEPMLAYLSERLSIWGKYFGASQRAVAKN